MFVLRWDVRHFCRSISKALGQAPRGSAKNESNESRYMVMIEAAGFPTVYTGAEWSLLKEESDRFEYRPE